MSPAPLIIISALLITIILLVGWISYLLEKAFPAIGGSRNENIGLAILLIVMLGASMHWTILDSTQMTEFYVGYIFGIFAGQVTITILLALLTRKIFKYLKRPIKHLYILCSNFWIILFLLILFENYRSGANSF